jgi:hypothetical protein
MLILRHTHRGFRYQALVAMEGRAEVTFRHYHPRNCGGITMECALAAVFEGNKVVIDGSIEGVVVFCSVSRSYSNDYPASSWPESDYDGIMIRQDNGALIFHETHIFKDGVSSIEVIMP